MSMNYREKLFLSYDTTHEIYLDSGDEVKINWFLKYFESNYLQHIQELEKKNPSILEIGCNKGYLLNAMYKFCYNNLHGVDLSDNDIEKAKVIVGEAKLFRMDANEYLKDNKEKFDVIILKAVLEHVEKRNVLTLLANVRSSLNDSGIVIIDVPNMDWLFASHERYMDFTHEVGFTLESLRQIMKNIFTEVNVFEGSDYFSYSFRERFKLKLARFILGKALLWADPQGASTPIWTRSIIGVGKK